MDPVSSDYSEEGNSEKIFWNKKKSIYLLKCVSYIKNNGHRLKN